MHNAQWQLYREVQFHDERWSDGLKVRKERAAIWKSVEQRKKKTTVIFLCICTILKSLSLCVEGFTYKAHGEVYMSGSAKKENGVVKKKTWHLDKSHDRKRISSNKIRVRFKTDPRLHTILPQVTILSVFMCLTLQVNVSPLWGVKETLLVRWNFQPCSKARSVCWAFGSSAPFFISLISMSGGWKSLTWQISVLPLSNTPGSRLYTWIFGGARDKDKDVHDYTESSENPHLFDIKYLNLKCGLPPCYAIAFQIHFWRPNVLFSH